MVKDICMWNRQLLLGQPNTLREPVGQTRNMSGQWIHAYKRDQEINTETFDNMAMRKKKDSIGVKIGASTKQYRERLLTDKEKIIQEATELVETLENRVCRTSPLMIGATMMGANQSKLLLRGASRVLFLN